MARADSRVLVTGATGCIGTYLARALASRADVAMTLVVREPSRLDARVRAHTRVRVVAADLREPDAIASLAPGHDALILAATSWGEEAEAINVRAVSRLADAAAESGAHVVYLSTASVLARDGTLLPEADTLGTPYIRTKHAATRALLARADLPVTVIFPTLVLGGGDGVPDSHLARLVREAAGRASLLRCVSADGSFHLVHAADVAALAADALARRPAAGAPRRIVAGGGAVTANELLDALLRATGRRRLARVPVNGALAELLIRAFRVQLAPWDRYCFERRHFVYDDAILPSSLGVTDAYPTLDALVASVLARPA